jgi:integrase/recombinase XerD
LDTPGQQLLADLAAMAPLPLFGLGLRGRLLDSGILQVVRRRSREAGLGKLHPHLFRHTFAHEMLSAGM